MAGAVAEMVAGQKMIVTVEDETDQPRWIDDLESGEPVGGAIGVGPEPGAVTVGGDAVWVVNNGDGTVTRVEP